jgi:hypothetical protein
LAKIEELGALVTVLDKGGPQDVDRLRPIRGGLTEIRPALGVRFCTNRQVTREAFVLDPESGSSRMPFVSFFLSTDPAQSDGNGWTNGG